MKKILSVFILLLLAFPIAAFAGELPFAKHDELVTLGADEVVERDFFAAGERVEISGTINGDLYVAGGEVLIDGTVDGDVLVAAGNVHITGSVTQDARIFGGDITISGTIGRNVSIAGGGVNLTEAGDIEGGLTLAAGNAILAGPIGSTLTAGVGRLVLSNTIGGAVDVGVGELRITSTADIEGDITYKSENEASISDDAAIGGAVVHKAAKSHRVPPEDFFGTFVEVILAAKLIGLLAALLIGLLMIRFYPHYMSRVVRTLEKRTWPSLGIGVVTLIVAPIFSAILMATIIGIPLGLILLAIYAITLYLAKVFFMLLLGNLIARKKRLNQYLALIIGGVVYTVLTLIPFIGPLIALFALLSSIGAIMISEKDLYKIAFKKEIV